MPGDTTRINLAIAGTGAAYLAMGAIALLAENKTPLSNFREETLWIALAVTVSALFFLSRWLCTSSWFSSFSLLVGIVGVTVASLASIYTREPLVAVIGAAIALLTFGLHEISNRLGNAIKEQAEMSKILRQTLTLAALFLAPPLFSIFTYVLPPRAYISFAYVEYLDNGSPPGILLNPSLKIIGQTNGYEVVLLSHLVESTRSYGDIPLPWDGRYYTIRARFFENQSRVRDHTKLESFQSGLGAQTMFLPYYVVEQGVNQYRDDLKQLYEPLPISHLTTASSEYAVQIDVYVVRAGLAIEAGHLADSFFLPLDSASNISPFFDFANSYWVKLLKTGAAPPQAPPIALVDPLSAPSTSALSLPQAPIGEVSQVRQGTLTVRNRSAIPLPISTQVTVFYWIDEIEDRSVRGTGVVTRSDNSSFDIALDDPRGDARIGVGDLVEERR